MCGITGRIDDIKCDDITYEDLYVASVAGLDDMTCDDLTYDDLSQVCVGVWDVLIIYCVTI